MFSDPSKPQNVEFINQMMSNPRKRVEMLTDAEYEELLHKAQLARQSAVMDKLTRASEMKPKHSALASELPKKPSVDAATAL